MKRILILALGLLMLAGSASAGCLRTGLQVDNTSLVDTVYFDTAAPVLRFAGTHVWIKLADDADGTVTIQRGIRASATTITFIDDVVTLEPGGTLKSTDENTWCFKFTKSTAGDKLYWSAGTCGVAEYESSVPDVVTDNVVLTNGYTIPASGIETFNTPLTPVGDHSTASFTIKCLGTAPDTTYFQIVAANTPMDSLTVLNIGTLAVPVLSGAVDSLKFAYPHPWHSTGVELPLGIDLKTLSNAKYLGIRLSPGNARAGTYYVVLNLK